VDGLVNDAGRSGTVGGVDVVGAAVAVDDVAVVGNDVGVDDTADTDPLSQGFGGDTMICVELSKECV